MFPETMWYENLCRNPQCESYGSDATNLCSLCDTIRGDTMAELIYDNEEEENDSN